MTEVLEIIIRSLSIFVGLFFISKLLGKKQLSELSFFEYVTGIIIGDIAGSLTMDIEFSIIEGITSLLLWSFLPVVISIISLKSIKFRNLVEGTSTVFIKDGNILEGNLKKEKYTADELLEELRSQRVFQLSDVEFALLEPSGSISILLKKEKQPLTIGDIIRYPGITKEPQTVIIDGEILEVPLSTMGLNRGWLNEELEKRDLTAEDIFLGQVASNGQLTLDLFDDKIDNPVAVSNQLLVASIKKCEADFDLYALQSGSLSEKQMYAKNAEKMKIINEKVGPYLR